MQLRIDKEIIKLIQQMATSNISASLILEYAMRARSDMTVLEYMREWSDYDKTSIDVLEELHSYIDSKEQQEAGEIIVRLDR